MHILLILKESQTSSFELSQDIKSSFPTCRYHPSNRQTRGQEMVEIGFPAQTEAKDYWAVTDREGRINGQAKCLCSCKCNKLNYLIQSKLLESTQA